MLKRLWAYLKEMYPVLPRLAVAAGVFFGIYLLILLNYGVTALSVGLPEITGVFTIFCFLLSLRIADDFKDYETDKELPPPYCQRPLPSGRVYKKDLLVMLVVLDAIALALNILFMNNFWFFLAMCLYGALTYFWFFQRTRMQKSLPMALVSHNPVQLFVNAYVASFTCIKYGLDWRSWVVALAVLALYLPGLTWEVGRKIKAPEEENEYTTYSKLFGYKKASYFVLIVILVTIAINAILIAGLDRVAVAVLALLALWVAGRFIRFIKDPTRSKIIDTVMAYTYVQEAIVLLAALLYLWVGKL